jgi:hypothetical protein
MQRGAPTSRRSWFVFVVGLPDRVGCRLLSPGDRLDVRCRGSSQSPDVEPYSRRHRDEPKVMGPGQTDKAGHEHSQI